MPEIFSLGGLASSAMKNASISAFTLRSDFICPEHLLHAMMLEKEGIAVEILREYGVLPDRVRQEVESGRKTRSTPPVGTQLPASTSTYDILARAKENCHNDGREIILTGDLLVGMLAENTNSAARTLHKLGITRDYLSDIQDEVKNKAEFNKEE